MHGDAGGVNLNVRGIGHVSTLAVALDGSRTVASHGVGGKEIGVAVATGGDNDGIGAETLELAGHQVLGNDTAGAPVYNDKIFHLITCVELHLTGLDHAAQ